MVRLFRLIRAMEESLWTEPGGTDFRRFVESWKSIVENELENDAADFMTGVLSRQEFADATH